MYNAYKENKAQVICGDVVDLGLFETHLELRTRWIDEQQLRKILSINFPVYADLVYMFYTNFQRYENDEGMMVIFTIINGGKL